MFTPAMGTPGSRVPAYTIGSACTVVAQQTSATPPKLGTDWVAELDVSDHPGATFVYVYGTDCLLNPGVMTPFGELLANPRGRAQISGFMPVFGARLPPGASVG